MSTMTEKEPGWLAERVRTLREEAGLSQLELARRCSMSLSVITQIEQGRTENPRINTLKAIAKALDVSVSHLIDEEE